MAQQHLNPDDVMLEARERAVGALQEASFLGRAGLRRLDVRQLLTEPPPPLLWLWEDLIERGEMVWLAGPGGGGKSLVALSLALCSLHARPILAGKVVGGVGRVVYIDGENREATIARRLHWLGMNLELCDSLDYLMATNADLASDEGRQVFNWLCQGSDLIVLDSLVCLHRAQENDAAEVRAFAAGLRAIAAEHGTTVLGLAHENRAGSIRGSLDWHNSADTILSLKTDKDGWRVLRVTKRRDGNDDVRPIEFMFRVKDSRLELALREAAPPLESPYDRERDDER